MDHFSPLSQRLSVQNGTHPSDPHWCHSPNPMCPGLVQGFPRSPCLQPNPTEGYPLAVSE